MASLVRSYLQDRNGRGVRAILRQQLAQQSAASAPPDRVKEGQARLGRVEAGELIERTLADIVDKLADQGLRRLVVAGGETSGAVVQALGVKGLRIGPEIAPGVPCTVTLDDDPMALTLKSGNFGDEDFFLKALEVMP